MGGGAEAGQVCAAVVQFTRAAGGLGVPAQGLSHQLRPSPRLRQTSDHHPHFSAERSEDQGGDTPSQRLLDLPRRQLLWARLEAVATDSSGPPPSSTSEPSIPQVSPQSQRGQGWFISQGRRGQGLRASPWGCRALGAGHCPGGVSCSLQSRSPPTLQGSRAPVMPGTATGLPRVPCLVPWHSSRMAGRAQEPNLVPSCPQPTRRVLVNQPLPPAPA